MITSLRDHFNANYTGEKYSELVSDLTRFSGSTIPFRIAETPVFIPSELREKLTGACNEIIEIISSPGYHAQSERAIPGGQQVPGNEGRPMWMAFDFAVCRDENGMLEPQLIELQGFPSLFYYQHILALKYRKYFDISSAVSHIPGRSFSEYEQSVRELILGNHLPQNVILLEVEPEKQPTRIDFVATGLFTGIKSICISKIKKSGKELYYFDDGKMIPIHRIYNRVIFDEFIQRNDLKCEFNLTDEVNVEWAGHPNWFFRISKFTMPFLNAHFVPGTRFLSHVQQLPSDLENYVLKPLFSFSGTGVIFHVNEKNINAINDPHNWILQRKILYAPAVKTPVGEIKAEIRMLYGWHPGKERPEWLINLVRLSQGEMIGVKYNRDKTWVGSSVGFFEA